VEEEGHTDPLEEEKIQTPQQILSQSEYLESDCHDIEPMQFFVTRISSICCETRFSFSMKLPIAEDEKDNVSV